MSEAQDTNEAADGQSLLTEGLGMAQILITCDSSPLMLFTKILEAALQGRQRFFDLSDLGFQLARVESVSCAASTGELLVRLYPSDAFLRFAATVFAGDSDLGFIQDSSHVSSLMPNSKIQGRLLGCPFCGEQPEITSLGTFIEITCCCSMSIQKSDHLSLYERAAFNNETFKYSDASERYVMRLAIEMWNTRKQPNDQGKGAALAAPS